MEHRATLNCVDGGVLVGILLLDFLVVALDQAQNPVVSGVGLTGKATGVAVSNILRQYLQTLSAMISRLN